MVNDKKENCWEFMKCGREPGGDKSAERDACPAATSEEYNGVNNGINGGRFCWKVAGTMCSNAIQGSFSLEIINCTQCAFFKKVREEEGPYFS